MRKVCIVGFGHIGTAIAAVLAKKADIVYGIDIDRNLIRKLNKFECPFEEPKLKKTLNQYIRDKKIICTTNFSYIRNADVIINVVGTPIYKKKPNLTFLKKSFKKISKYVKKNSLIILKSTVLPETTINIYNKYFTKKNVLMCYSPERIAEGNLMQEFLKIPIIIGGINKKSAIASEKFFKKYLNVKIIQMQNSTEAELVKLCDNLWIDLNIALGNEIAKVCNVLDVDALNVIKAANSLKKGSHNVNILSPSVGVGGYCLTKDPWFLYNFSKEKKINLYTPRISRKINDGMPRYVYSIFKKYIIKNKIKNPSILILGYSFKSNSGDIRFTPVEKFLNLLDNDISFKDYNVVDPLVDKEKIANKIIKNKFLDFEKIINGQSLFDIMIFMNGHSIFKKNINNIKSRLNNGGLIIDCRYYFNKNEINKIKKRHNFFGVGW